MLDKRRTKSPIDRIHGVQIAGGLPVSVSLLRDLVRFLNETRTIRGRKIVGILEQMLEIDDLAQNVEGPILLTASLEKADPTKYRLLWEIEVKTAHLKKELSKYRFIPRAEVAVGGKGGTTEWAAWWRRDLEEKPEPKLRMIPSEALELILKLTQIDCLTRLRHCQYCHGWLYARYRHQQFCSIRCQQLNYTDTDEFRAHRAEYMRGRYRRAFRDYNPGRSRLFRKR